MSAQTLRAFAFWALLTGLAGTPGGAQELRGGTTAVLVQRRVSYLGTVDEQTGFWVGVEGSVKVRRVTIGASGFFGSLARASDALATPNLDVRVSALFVETTLSDWFDVGAVAEARRYQSDVGVNIWRLIGPQLRVTPELGLPSLAASVELTYFASASVIGGAERLSPAIRAVVGTSWTPPRFPLLLRVNYRFERFDFGAVGTDPARLEQFSGLELGAEIPWSRRKTAGR